MKSSKLVFPFRPLPHAMIFARHSVIAAATLPRRPRSLRPVTVQDRLRSRGSSEPERIPRLYICDVRPERIKAVQPVSTTWNKAHADRSSRSASELRRSLPPPPSTRSETPMAPLTTEGYHWTPQTGMQEGVLRCKGVVEPPCRLDNSFLDYDVIVIGAGYAGLMAARELVQKGTCRLQKRSSARIICSADMSV